MSHSLLPVSASNPPSSHFTPSESRWGTRTVALLLGAGALGLAFYLYRRFASEPRSEPTTPFGTPRRRSLDSPRISFIDRQHSSEMTHHGKRCLNEIKALGFDHFAEGLVKLYFSLGRTDAITVRCSYQDQEFSVCKEKNSKLPVAFFIPNMPYGQTITLKIDFESEGKQTSETIEMDVKHPRGSYVIRSSGYSSSPMPAQTKTYTDLLHIPRPIATPFEVVFNQEHQVVIRDELIHKTILIDNHSMNTLAYFKIVHKNPNDSKEIAIALPFFFLQGEKKILSPSTLIELWQDAYEQATGQEAPADLNLELVEVKLITYIEEDSYDFSREGSDSD